MRVRTTWAVALLLVASLGCAASFHGAAAPLLLAVMVLVPFGAVALGRAWRLGTTLSALLVIIVGVAAGWLVLRGDDVRVGDAVPRLLTTPRPAPAELSLLAPLLLAVLLVAALVASVVLADGVRAALVVPVVAAAVLYTGAQLLSAGSADRHGIAAAALVIIAVGGWSQPYLRGGGQLAWRPVAAVPVALAAVLALGAGALVTSTASFDPRRHVQPPTVRLQTASPLGQLRSWIANPQVRILSAKLTGTDRMHLATLDTFTGADWQVDDRYQQLGLPAADDALPQAKRTRPARATVRLDRLGGVWLPGVGTATGASLDGLLLDPDDGTLARPGRIAPGLEYSVQARVDLPTQQQLSVAAVPVQVPARYLALPNAPVAFGSYARAAVRGASTPFEEAVALENAVVTGRRLDPKAASGSSYGRLSTFLFGRAGTPGAGAGTAEQFAASFAVLARAVGLPTRLTVGFDVGAGKTTVVRGRDATVWPEVYLGNAGWVAFAPTPGSDDSGAGGALRDSVLQRLSQRPEQDPMVPPVITPATSTPQQSGAVANHDLRAGDHALPTWLLVLLVVLAAVALVLVLILVMRARRTRRHRDRGARGAWAEIVDLLVLVGRRPGAQQAAPDIAAGVDDLLGEAAAIVAAAADREAFAPGNESAPPVWGHVRTLRRRAGATLPLHRRVLLPVDPRPLLRR